MRLAYVPYSFTISDLLIHYGAPDLMQCENLLGLTLFFAVIENLTLT